MQKYKLTIEMLPRGAWNNDFSKTLPKKEWDILREACYKKANHKCQICGYETDELDAHELWDFDIKNKTQTLVDIIGICSKCHGVKHIRNSQRLGYGENAKQHFLNINKCSALDYASQLAKAQMEFEERNKVYRWKIIADLNKFGLKNATLKQRNIPFIKNPYEDVDWDSIDYREMKNLFEIKRTNDNLIGAPKINYIEVDNYQGTITISSLFANSIIWFLDDVKIKTKYNVIGEFNTTLKVEDLDGRKLYFILLGDNGQIISKIFELIPQEVI